MDGKSTSAADFDGQAQEDYEEEIGSRQAGGKLSGKSNGKTS